MTLTLPVSGCLGTSDAVLCQGTLEEREELRAALLADGGDQSVVSGAILLRTMEDACKGLF